MKFSATCFLFMIFFLNSGIAQTISLKGKITDTRNAPLGFVNVSLLNAADSSFAMRALAGEDGTFQLNAPGAGKYRLRLSSIGFSDSTSAAFDLVTGVPKDFGTIILKPAVNKLGEVTVSALRPTIVQKADRMVVGIEGTAMAAGNTAFNVLGKAPGVFIDHEGNIQLNGRAGVTVMIDGRLTYLSANDLRNLLESMPAENIKNIEIITNPSSRYDAEGSSGMINIVLKKNDIRGMNGSVSAGYNYNGLQHGYTSAANINYKIGDWNSFFSTDFSQRVGGREATFTRIFFGSAETTYFDQVATGNYSSIGPPSIRLGTEYSISKKQRIGLLASYRENSSDSEFLTETWMGPSASAPNKHIDADNFSNNRFRNFTSNLHYGLDMDTLGANLSSDLDYVRIRNTGGSNFYNYFQDLGTQGKVQDFLYTDQPSGYDIYSAKLDYTKPFGKGKKLELGAKASRVISDTDSRFYFNNGSLELDPLRTNHFNYKENIYAAYANFNSTLGKKLTVQAGLRAEQTSSTGESYTTGEINDRNYLNLFPTLFVQQKVNDNYGINYSYSRRLGRPNYGYLNPFVFYRDPYTYIQGNPFLRPQYTNAFSVTQVIKKTYNVILGYQDTKDLFSELPRLDVEKKTTIYYYGNMEDSYAATFTGIVPVKISKNWDSNNTLFASYNKMSIMDASGPLVNKRWFGMIQSNQTVRLPKSIIMELGLMYRGKAVSGLYRIAPMSRVDLAFKRSFLNKKLDLTINGSDLFKGSRLKFTTDINGNVNDFDQYMRSRTFGLNLRYNFSKGQKVEEVRRTRVEELNRT